MTEVNRMRDSLVTPEELEISKQQVHRGSSRAVRDRERDRLSSSPTRADGRYQKDPKYFTEVRDRIRAVTREDVQRVAKRLIDPVEVHGAHGRERQGHDARRSQARRHASRRWRSGEPKHLPMRDPLTMKSMPNPERDRSRGAPPARPAPARLLARSRRVPRLEALHAPGRVGKLAPRAGRIPRRTSPVR